MHGSGGGSSSSSSSSSLMEMKCEQASIYGSSSL
jgi:hypothetical protein